METPIGKITAILLIAKRILILRIGAIESRGVKKEHLLVVQQRCCTAERAIMPQTINQKILLIPTGGLITPYS